MISGFPTVDSCRIAAVGVPCSGSSRSTLNAVPLSRPSAGSDADMADASAELGHDDSDGDADADELLREWSRRLVKWVLRLGADSWQLGSLPALLLLHLLRLVGSSASDCMSCFFDVMASTRPSASVTASPPTPAQIAALHPGRRLASMPRLPSARDPHLPPQGAEDRG